MKEWIPGIQIENAQVKYKVEPAKHQDAQFSLEQCHNFPQP